MRKDLHRAVTLVRRGQSYGAAAEAVGITRNAVAGACNRAGVKVADRAERQAEGGRTSAHTLWANPASRKKAAARMRARWRAGGDLRERYDSKQGRSP